MRWLRLIISIVVALLGIGLLWRQIVQRRRVEKPYPSSASLPDWSSETAPSSNASITKGLATTAERTHNQSDALVQPQESATSALSQMSENMPLNEESKTQNELGGEPDTAKEADDDTEHVIPDDLLRIEGIGPRVSTIVVAAGITTFAELAATDIARLQAILDEAGIHTANPTTWPKQASLAAQGKWDALQQLQDRIKNGRLEN